MQFPRPEQFDTGMLGYFHTLEKLKTEKRTGWVNKGVKSPESVADHMYRMAMIALTMDDKSLDIPKCIMMSLVHDLAEADVGDITPFAVSGTTREEKLAKEEAAMHRIAHLLPDPVKESSLARTRLMALWEEYEARETVDAIFVKDLDMFELGLQAVEYERSNGTEGLQSFFLTTIPKIKHPDVKKWATQLMEERRALWVQRGWSDYVHVDVTDPAPVEVNGISNGATNGTNGKTYSATSFGSH